MAARAPGDYTLPTRRKVMPRRVSLRRRLRSGAAVAVTQMIEAVDDAFRDVDVLLTASGMDPPFRIDDGARPGAHLSAPGPQPVQSHRSSGAGDDGRAVEAAGLPLSVQFVGRSHDEVTLLRVAAAYERVTQWSRHRPPMHQNTSPRSKVAGDGIRRTRA